MTTIATDGRSMAGDGLTTGGNQRVALAPKIRKAKDGRIFGCAGRVVAGRQFARWMDDPSYTPTDLDDDFEALILNPDGTVEWCGKELEPIKYLSPMAIGSGEGLALGAMLAGKSPIEAVEIAIKRDIRSGGPVTEISLETLKAVA